MLRPASTFASLLLTACSACALAACALIADLGERSLEDNDGGTWFDGDGDTPGEPGTGCDAVKLSNAEMYFIVDQSGSMVVPSNGSSKEKIVDTALTTFVRSEQSKSSSAGLAFFPPKADTECGDLAAHSVAKVPLRTLDTAGATAIADALTATSYQATFSTWSDALTGAKTPLGGYVNSGKKPVVVFIADQFPSNSCVGSGGTAEERAIKDLQSLSKPVRTYVVGMPDPASTQATLFDRLARAGATDHASAFTNDAPTTQWLSGVLAQIRDELRCEFDFDDSKNSVELDGDAIALVDNAEACKTTGGFYVLHDGSGSTNGRARLCPTSCTKALDDASIEACE